MNKPLFERENLPEKMAAYLAEAIIGGELAGGERIGEQDWAQRLNASRSSIREALIILERQHLVELSPGKGARVAPLDERWLTEVYELWYLLFKTVAIRVVGVVDEAQVDDLQRRIEALQSAADPQHPQLLFDQALGLVLLLAQLADQRLLGKQLRTLLPAAKRCYRVVLWADQAETTRTLAVAEALLNAVKVRDVDMAEAAIDSYAASQRAALDRAIALT